MFRYNLIRPVHIAMIEHFMGDSGKLQEALMFERPRVIWSDREGLLRGVAALIGAEGLALWNGDQANAEIHLHIYECEARTAELYRRWRLEERCLELGPGIRRERCPPFAVRQLKPGGVSNEPDWLPPPRGVRFVKVDHELSLIHIS